MTGRDEMKNLPGPCADCRGSLQEYLDGTLEKTRSLEVFLHLRDCGPCQAEHDELQALFGLLESLPAQPVPEDFDAPILASIPLDAYRAMAPLRRERVPVLLQEEALPALVRAPVVRASGLVVAAAAVAAVTLASAPPVLLVGAAGALPEALVRLQAVGRTVALAVRRAEG
jgi:anti-sigma factor RsiW